MRVLLPTYGSRGDVEPQVGLALVTGVTPPSAVDKFRLAAELVAGRFDTLAAAAEGCDALVATGLMPAGVRSVAEKLGIHYVYAATDGATVAAKLLLDAISRSEPMP